MIVVADTSVILNLCRVQHEHLLPPLFGHVLIPYEVATEFERLARVGSRFVGLQLPVWIEQVAAPSPPAVIIEANLDLGETAALTLCLSSRADALLMDESLGRALAAQLGLKPIGIIGILLEARRRGLIGAVEPVLERLESDAGFWIAPGLRRRVLGLAGE